MQLQQLKLFFYSNMVQVVTKRFRQMSYVKWPNVNDAPELKDSMTSHLENIKKAALEFQKEMEKDIARE